MGEKSTLYPSAMHATMSHAKAFSSGNTTNEYAEWLSLWSTDEVVWNDPVGAPPKTTIQAFKDFRMQLPDVLLCPTVIKIPADEMQAAACVEVKIGDGKPFMAIDTFKFSLA